MSTDKVGSDDEIILNKTDAVETHLAVKEIGKQKVKLANFIVTKATKKILTNIKTKQCLLITGSIGSGKSVNAYYAAFELEKEGFQVIVATPSELLKFCKINTKQLLILDDVIGKYTVEKYNVQWLEQNGAALTSLLNINANTKIIMTCRSHLYNKCILQRGYIAYEHCDLLSEDLQLTLKERKKICEKYLKRVVMDEITDEVIMLYDFWPSLCDMFSKEKRNVEFFTHPFDYLTYEIRQFQTREEFEYLVLALLVILNNNVEFSICNLSCKEHEKLLENVYLDSSFKQLPAKGLLFNTFTSLVGTFVKDKSSSFSFMNEALFETVLVCVGKSFANCILTYSSCTFIKDRLQLHFNEAPDDNLRIILDPCFKDSFFFRLLSDIKAGYITIVFANFQLQFKCFWTILLNYLTKDQKARLSVDTADGSTIIHVVSTNGYADMLEEFLKVDSALINQTDNRKNTALHIACSNEQQNIVEILLKNNAGANTKGENMRTPLHLAAINGNTTIAGYLLKCNAVLNQKDKDGLTPLHLACIKDRSSMVQYLLDHNAKVNSIDAVSRTPLYIACEKNSLKIIQTLLKHKVDINKVSEDGNGPLHVACENGYCNVVSALCEQNANVEQYTTHGDTPLILACQAGHQSVVEILLNHKAKTNKNSRSGSTPLYESCAIGHANIVKTLLARGADVNQISGNGHFTALAISCSMGNAKIVELLLQKGADIDKPDKNGRTPLCIAALGGNLEVVKILISYKAAVNKADCNGQTPLLFACTVGRIDIVEELLKHGNLDIVNNARTTPLHIACTKGSVDIVNILAQNNAKINAQDENGKTPLLNACLKDHMQIAEMLIKRGASANICDNKGISPLSIASQKGLTALIKLLKHSTEQ